MVSSCREVKDGPIQWFTWLCQMLLVCLAEFLSIVLSFGRQKPRAWIYLLVSLLLFPIKFLDLPFIGHSTFVSLAPTIFGVYRKP